MENTNEEVVESEVAEVEEAPKKSFNEMTDDEKLSMDDKDLIEQLEEGEEEPETPAEEEPEAAKEEEISESEFERIEKLSESEISELPKDKRGIYHEMKSERQKRQETEKELDRLKSLSDAQIEIMRKMKEGTPPPSKAQPKSEYERVVAELDMKAEAYQTEYGEDYRLTLADQKALDRAKQVDYQVYQQQAQVQQEIQQVDSVTQAATTKLKARLGDGDDWDHVYKTFIEPVVNPNLAQNRELAVANARTLIHLAKFGGDPAEYAYEVLSKMTPEGRAYFAQKELKGKNAADVSKSSKEITKTTSHLDSTKSSTGKIKVTEADLMKDFNKWNAKLTQEQFLAVAAGEEVYV